MKQRFSSIDVRVLSLELSSTLINHRLSNIYDLSSRIFLFKFAKPGSKHSVLVDSGFRCHLTSFARTTAAEPSAFVRRLRKYLKSRRVTGVRQIGTDRVIELDLNGQYKLYLEFFAAGNIILTDGELNVLALLRQVNEGDEDVDVRLGSKYVLDAKQNYAGVPPITEERVRDALEKAATRVKTAKEAGGKMAKRAKSGDDIRKALSAGFPEYPAHLLECAFDETDVDVTWPIAAVLEDASKTEKIMQALQQAESISQSLNSGPWRGYIVAKVKEGTQPPDRGTQPSRDDLLYDDFHPFRPKQFDNKQGTHIVEIAGFNAAVDDFYSSVESQKLSSRLTEREETAKRKLQSAKDEHDKRLGALQHVQEIHIRKAQAIEANTHRVEEACGAVNGLIAQGLDWVNISKLIENEQSRGNVVAQMIKLPLKLHENTVTLLLEEDTYEDSESDDEDRTDSEASDSDDEDRSVKQASKPDDKRLAIDIDLALSPWSNARQYYDQKKQAAVKEQKTILASGRALKSTERKIADDLKKGLKQEKDVLREVRPQFWFEKFLWFISSEGYLCLSGKDAPQSEILYRRYCKKGDVYVHADLTGASPVIVKNNPDTPDAPIPPGTLSQAGAFCVCGSHAWDSKAVMSAWWVLVDQTSRVHEATGELVTGGGVSVKGKKNWLPPSQLLLGFAVGWLIGEESRGNHGKLRVGAVDGTAAATQAVESMSLDETAPEEAAEEQDEDDDPAESQNGEEGEVVPDVEDAGSVAEEALGEDHKANEDIEQPHIDVAEDDEEHESDNEDSARSNPLQSAGPGAARDTHESNDNDGEDDEDSDTDEDNEADQATSSQPPTTTDSTAPSTRPETPSSIIPTLQPSTHKSKQLPRGKRSKAQRRAQAKYADQDEEDRALALSLLGTTKATERAAAEAAEKEAAAAKTAADRERRKRNQEKAAEREKAKALATNGADTAEEVDEETLARERTEHANTSLIVPHLRPNDIVLAAIPICAPWTALNRYKYKVKLQPGSLKKGKAVREILGQWQSLGGSGTGPASKVRIDESNSDREKVWRVEVEKLKMLRDVEVLGQVPVKGVRVVLGGGLAGGSAGSAGSGGAGGRGKAGGGGGSARGGKGGKRR
jgi:predicted ribosome quality control (RQC) complex YloA/Tae2 family protein